MKRLRSNKGEVVGEVVMILLAIAFALLIGCRGAFVGEDIAYRSMETQGYSNIKVVDKAYFFVGIRGCSGQDAARFTVQATNPAGKDISCYVCTGWIFKAATIRTK